MAGTKLKEIYETNDDFREYVDRYSRTYGITVEQALKSMLVRLVAKHYTESYNK